MSAVPLNACFTVKDYSFLNARLLWCYEGEVLEENRRKLNRERHIHAWCIQRGSVTMRRGAKSWSAHAGEWIFGAPHPHHQDFSTDARILSISFKVEWPSGDSLIDQPLVVPAKRFLELAAAARSLLRFIRRNFQGVRNDLWGSPVALVSFFELHQLFSRWMTAYLRVVLASGIVPTRMAGLDARVLAALRRLDQHAWPAPFHEAALAGELGLSAGHLDRLFVQQLGLTPRAYLQKRRFESAAALLAESGLPAKNIGYDLGFSSPAHFCHWFRQATGQTPLQFRAAGGKSPPDRPLKRKKK